MKLNLLLTVASLTLATAQLPALAQAAPPTAEAVAKSLGFTAPEIAQIKAGEVVSKDLKEGSEKELAGVVAVFFPQPLAELAEKALDGKFLESDPAVQVQVWKPEADTAGEFAKIALQANETDEASQYLKAATGSKLNLSAAEISQFQKLKSPGDVNATLRATLIARYEAYRKSGLAGLAPYARSKSDTVLPGKELTLALQESLPGTYLPAYRQALLNYPANPLADMQHRFYWYKQAVEDRPTFILAHRTSLKAPDLVVLTEEQYYVSHSYNCNFVVCAGFTVQGGTLVFYMNRTFTDQVAGFASSLRHSIGRKQMLAEVATTLKGIRDQVPK